MHNSPKLEPKCPSTDKCINSDITLQWNSTQQYKELMDVSTLINLNEIRLGKGAKHKNIELYDSN